MIDGTYKQRVDWRSFESPRAAEILDYNVTRYTEKMYNTCGTGAISLLTGLMPKHVERNLPKSNQHWTDFSILKFLKARKFRIASVSKNGITNLSPRGDEFETMPLNENHVLLCCLLMCRNEASWFVINNGYIFHNFTRSLMTPLYLLNKPSQSSYVVTHPKWK
jgi:hypothetical protein